VNDDVSGWSEVGVLAVQFNGRTTRYLTRVLATQVVVAGLWTVHQRMYVRQTHGKVLRVFPCVTPLQPFLFFFRTDYTIPQTFIVTSEHIRFYSSVFFVLDFLVVVSVR